MSTYTNGNINSATANSKKAARNSAAKRQCPKCERKAALVHDADQRATYCRWSLVDVWNSRSHGTERVRACDYYEKWEF